MRKLLSGLIGVVWGGSMLYFWGIVKGFEKPSAVGIGAVMFIAGIYYIIKWKKERK
jgi:hypothetical protein